MMQFVRARPNQSFVGITYTRRETSAKPTLRATHSEAVFVSPALQTGIYKRSREL